VRVNDLEESVASFDLDELRPALALGPDGRLAVAWGDRAGDVRVALSRDRGASFDASIVLNQDDGDGAQSFPSIAFDPEGVLHAVWLDTRVSGTPDEEPADIYYARVRDGEVEEANLTDDDTPSVCGCCRPHIAADGSGELSVAFRNTTTDGYRDIFRVSGSLDRGFSTPRRVGPPTWELSGCPMAGPLVVGPDTLWNDASTGDRRTLVAGGLDETPRALLESGAGFRVLYPPRRIAGDEGVDALFLVPADPAGRLIRRDADGGWEVLPGTVPRWATSAALLGGELLVAGRAGEELKVEALPWSP
jgi:hypothetical protein